MAERIDYQEHVRVIEDFPSPGVRFYDCAPLIGNAAVFNSLIEDLAAPLEGRVDKLVAFDARGFIFAGAMAIRLGVGMAMLRKPGKLPGEVSSISYELEYGSNQLEIQADSLQPGERIALVDDVIATGGTALAGIELVRKQTAEIVEFTTVIDIPGLGGSSKIKDQGVPVRALIKV